MGTRALISVVGSGVTIYRHWGGYPERTIPLLETIVSTFLQKRSFDPAYMTAYIVYRLKEAQDDSDKLTGFGILKSEESFEYSDIEFSYIIYADRPIEIISGNGFSKPLKRGGE